MLDEPEPLFTPKPWYKPPRNNFSRLNRIGSTCFVCEGAGCEECQNLEDDKEI